MPSAIGTQRQQLLHSLKGQELHIPDLQSLLESWPQYENPELPGFRGEVDEWLESIFPDPKRLQRMKAADPALFGALWWPYASRETLRIGTYLSIWLFAWDDETDSSEFSSLVSDVDKAQAFRAETLRFALKCLNNRNATEDVEQPSNRIVASFRPVGEAIARSCTKAQIDTFTKQLKFYLGMTGLEQQSQMEPNLPSIGEYRRRRMGSSAVGHE
ncbi:MAG: hypothetical protein Q9222_002637 [Ikaeria aurantiellina]